MLFKQVIGQSAAKQQLLHMAEQGRLPHAIMLSAADGTGGLPMALALTQYIYCENKQQDDACGECDTCIKVGKLTHPDLHFSFPVVKTKSDKVPVSTDFYKEFREVFSSNPYTSTFDWVRGLTKENKQANITANECREIIQKLNLRSFERGYKVLILWRPEFLGNEGNILLKLIEEPPQKTILIFVCEQYDKILGTIQSRTQLVQLASLSIKEIQDALIHQGIESSMALKIARLSNGNFYEALRQSQNFHQAYSDWMRNWFNALYTRNGVAITHWVQEMSDHTRDEQKQFLENAISLLENQLRVKWLPTDYIYLPGDELDFIQKLIKNNVTENKIKQLCTLWNDAIYHIERNANAKILFHGLSLQTKDILLQTTS